jgi:G3E family GTPase
VDSKHVHLHLDESTECQEQLAFADVILLNKTDLVSSADLDNLEQRIRAMNRVAKIHRTRDAAIDLDEILDVRAFDLSRARDIDPSFLSDTAHEHDATVSSVGIDIPGDLDGKKLEKWMGSLLMNRGTDIFRMKGILSVKGDPNQLVLQGVHMLMDSAQGRAWKGATRGNKLVFIGRHLNREELNRGFAQCLA